MQLQHRTSEICQMEKLMIDDLRQEIEDSKKLEQDIIKYEEQCLQDELQPQQQQKDFCNLQSTSLFDKIKNEIKNEETQDTKHHLEMMHSNNDSNSNFCSNLQNTTSSFDSIKNEIKTESFDNSMASTTGGKSCSSSMDSFDLLKQSSMTNNVVIGPKKTVDANESKKDDNLSSTPVSEWNQDGYLDTKPTNNFYNHLSDNAAAPSITKNSSHLFNGVLKKSSPNVTSASPTQDKKDNYENFDIESEITPTFIMKKVEHKETTPQTPTVKPSTASTSSVTSTIATSNTSSITLFNKKIKTSKSNSANLVENSTSDIAPQPPALIPPQQQLSQNPPNAQPEVLTSNFDFSHLQGHAGGGNKHQDDDWLCIQKELNLMNSADNTVNNKNSDTQNKSLDFLTHATSEDIFPNGCMTKSLQQQPSQELTKTNCNISTLPSSCSQQNQQPLALQLNHHQEESHHADLNEFFSGSDEDNSEVHKAVENRLESMFGESPVHISGSKERLNSPDDLDSIFGETGKSSSNLPCNEFPTNTFMASSTAQHSQGDFINSTNSMAHHIQLTSANNPRWMQNMEAQFPEFLTSNNADCMGSRKRQWNGHLVADNQQQQQHQEQQAALQQDDESPQKKMCSSLPNSVAMNDVSSGSSTSPQQQQQHHNMVPNDTSHAQDLMDAALLSLHDGLGVEPTATDANSQPNGYAHMVMTPTNFPNFNNQMDGQQSQQQSHFMNANQQQNLTNHMMHHMNHHGHHAGAGGTGSGEFDDDITRHVQNAIDSILNLQSSEADSLSFSLDHSMGALLGDTMLHDNQTTNNPNSICHEAAKRRQLVDELGDCLMGGGNSSTDASNLTDGHCLMDNTATSHQHHTSMMNHNNMQHALGNHQMANSQSQHQGQQQPPQLNDFNCVVGSIDETVKSIMTS